MLFAGRINGDDGKFDRITVEMLFTELCTVVENIA